MSKKNERRKWRDPRVRKLINEQKKDIENNYQIVNEYDPTSQDMIKRGKRLRGSAFVRQ